MLLETMMKGHIHALLTPMVIPHGFEDGLQAHARRGAGAIKCHATLNHKPGERDRSKHRQMEQYSCMRRTGPAEPTQRAILISWGMQVFQSLQNYDIMQATASG